MWKNDVVEKIALEAIDATLKDEQYVEAQVLQWNNNICERTIEGLSRLENPFKYVVTCVIMQRNGSGVHSATSCYWDTSNDGVVTVIWPKEKGKEPNGRGMQCIVTVFGADLG